MEMNPRPGTQLTGTHPLPCGRTVEAVWDELESAQHDPHPDPHLADCPHCQTAKAGLEELAVATALLIDEPVDVPTGMLDRVMTAVRADLNLGKTLPLSAHVELSVPALAAVLRYAVDAVPGIRARQCRVELSADRADAIDVRMTVALKFGTGQVLALDEARTRVAAVVRAQVGLALDRLDFEVVDVWTEPR
ncbi:hypothetical protein FB561_3652 [Kribbella amoyensis]|uniref:Uncharacterized protein n=1 Tax=Kribbella amoyensis TaxID=996641 RepID=A0A561BUH2_9ACTN|nr:Asp23/Gls24 family envelope stress response protein [Kribbella amoyensis]TWD82519.1 hypothetical protein FB561_3652 [Kribbella amoyensis]